MKQKVLALILSLCMIIGLTACTNEVVNIDDINDIIDNVVSTENNNLIDDFNNFNDSDTSDLETEPETVQETQALDDNISKDSGIISVKEQDYFYYSWNEEYECITTQVRFRTVVLNDESTKKYPKLAKAISREAEDVVGNGNATYEAMQAEIKIHMEEYPDDFIPSMEANEYVSVRRADSKAFSLLYTGFEYWGGVHGVELFRSTTYDSQTGKVIELWDVITDRDALKDCVEEQIGIYYPECNITRDSIDYYFDNVEECDMAWTLDYNGVTFNFATYDLASYADGTQTVTLGFNEYPEIFNKEYMSVPDKYVVSFRDYYPMYFDLDNDGTLDMFNIIGYMGEEYAYTSNTITVNGNWYDDDIWSYAIDPLFVHLGDDNNYLYVQYIADNDYRTIGIYKIGVGDIEKLEEIPYGCLSTYEMDSYDTKDVITDPDNFVLGTRTDMLSTLSASMDFVIGQDGMPVAQDKWFKLEGVITLTLLMDLEAPIVDDITGEILSNDIIPAGSQVEIYRTDNKDYTDVRLADGRIARIMVDKSDWPAKVNGIDIDMLFDGMLFAG